jgi:hypothetical protein
MSLVLTQEGASLCWSMIWDLGRDIGIPYCHLFGSAHSPSHTDTQSTYAGIELIAGGYAPYPLVNASVRWTVAPIPPGAQAAYQTIVWSLTSACSIYGYWLSDQSDTYSLWGELFAVVYTYPSVGGVFQLALLPTLTSTPSVAGVPCP